MTTLAVGIERLTALVDHIDKMDKPNRFNFRIWAGNDWKGDLGLSCGTNRCALGEATAIPLFQHLGLALKKETSSYNPTLVTAVLLTLNGREIIRLHDRIWAAAELFGISVNDWHRLFIPSDDFPVEGTLLDRAGQLCENVTAQEWVAHARGIIKELQQKET